MAGTLMLSVPAFAAFVITPTFTAAFNTNFGANAGAAQAAWIAAANVFTTNFTDNINVNITVDAAAGTAIFGQSSTFLNSFTYAAMRGAVNADAKTADDAAALAGSVSAADPLSGTHSWWTTTAEAKALGLIANNLSTDGTITFGAGNPFTFSGAIGAGTYDFKGVAAHEIAEVLGRLGLSGGTIGGNVNSYSLIDLFSYSGAGVRVLNGGGPGANTQGSFSIDNGATLLKQYNDAFTDHLDTRDWAGGTNDSFNQFSNSGVVNSVSDVDLREMDVIGYDRASVPEPATALLLVSGLAVGAFLRRRAKV